MTVSFVLTNDGPEVAYRLESQGQLDTFNRIQILDDQVDLGSFTYTNAALRSWHWSIDELAPGASAQLDFTFMLEQANVGRSFDFTASMEPYGCDPDDDDLSVTAVVQINSNRDQGGLTRNLHDTEHHRQTPGADRRRGFDDGARPAAASAQPAALASASARSVRSQVKPSPPGRNARRPPSEGYTGRRRSRSRMMPRGVRSKTSRTAAVSSAIRQPSRCQSSPP